MKQTIGFSQFCDAFWDTYKGNFSYNGKRALFDYLERLEEDTGEDIELDIVALCVEYTEYDTAVEAATEYSGFEVNKDLSEDENEKAAKQFLENRTTLIEFDGGVIIQDF